MQELRFVAVSEDGSYAVLAVPGRSGRFILPIDERLRAVALGQSSRLAQYEIEVESPLRPKEIQARIRAGETAEEIADAAGIPVERVRWFEGPVLAERAYIADQAQAASVRRAGDSAGPGPRLGDIVPGRLSAAGADPADGQWDSRKRGDGNWQVTLTFPAGGRLHVAEWVFDPRRRHVLPDDDNAARLSLPETELPAQEPVPGEATVTPLAPRLGAAAGMGAGMGGFGASEAGVRAFRPDRSVIPDRSLGTDRGLAEPTPHRGPAGEPPRRAARPERAAAAQVPDGPASVPLRAAPGAQSADMERTRLSPSRTVMFEDPEPAFPGEQPGPATAAGHAGGTQVGGHAGGTQVGGLADGRLADGGQAAAESAPLAAAQVTPAAPPAPLPAYEARPDPAHVAVPAQAAAVPTSQAPTAAAQATQAATTTQAPHAAAAAVTAPVAGTEPSPTPAASEPAVPASAAAPPVPGPGPVPANPAEPAARNAPAPQSAEPPASGSPASEPPASEPARPRPGGKKSAKARRSSVPSWDEIMLGSSRQRD